MIVPVRKAVLCADAHPVVRAGLACLLAATGDLELAGEAGDGHRVLALLRERRWDLLVLDLPMPGRNGLELIKLVRAEWPRLPLLVFTGQREEMYAVRAIRAGARGFVPKCAEPDVLLAAIRSVCAGGVAISSNVAATLAHEPERDEDSPAHHRLTDREYGIFARIVNGSKLTDIAEELRLSIKTVSTHKSNILGKLALAGQAEMVRYAIEHRLLEPSLEAA